MKHLRRFNENTENDERTFQYFWVRFKEDGNTMIAEREISDGIAYWNFIGSDEFMYEDKFKNLYEIVKEIENID